MVVVVIVGVLSAVGAPSIARLLQNASSQRALVESAATVSTARDSARGFGTCLEYLVEPPPPRKGPYSVRVFAINCPDDGTSVRKEIGVPQALSPKLTELLIRPVRDGYPGDTIAAIHFDRSGGLYDPVAELRLEGIYDGEPRHFSVFPAAGTVSIEERK